MTEHEHIALIDRLRGMPTETEWFEFKRNRYDAQDLGEYLSALANSACLASRPRGYLVFGIDDATHAVLGTDFDPYTAKAKGNQGLLPWLATGLRPNTGFEPHIVEHPDGRVVLFEVGPANGEPVAFYGTPHVRVGSSKTVLRNHPEKARRKRVRSGLAEATGQRRSAKAPHWMSSTRMPSSRPASSSSSSIPAKPPR